MIADRDPLHVNRLDMNTTTLVRSMFLAALGVAGSGQLLAQTVTLDPDFQHGDTAYGPGYGFNSSVNMIMEHSDGRLLVGGPFTNYHGANRKHIARLFPDGTLDPGFDPGSGLDYYVRASHELSDGRILIAGSFNTYNGVMRKYIARLHADGSLDLTFNPGQGANDVINSIGVQSDGRIVIAGRFTTYGGVARNRVARLNDNGSLDTTFNPGSGADNAISAMVVQSNGKIMIAGDFQNFNGMGRNRITRLDPDGSLDGTFNVGWGANGTITSMVVQNDGRILIGGAFTAYNTTDRWHFARLSSTGAVDNSFNPGTGPVGSLSFEAWAPPVYTISLQSDGKVLIGGAFTQYNGTSRNRLARINSNGSLDASFTTGSGVNEFVSVIAVQSDGRIVVGGAFGSYNDIHKPAFLRLSSTGELEMPFHSGRGPSGAVNAMAVQSDGKILIGGEFTLFDITVRNRIARLNSDGTLDTSFDPGMGANDEIGTMAIQNDGKILIAGVFTAYDGVARRGIARLNADGSLDPSFDPGTGVNIVTAPVGRYINSIVVQNDGKILIGGSFTEYNGVWMNQLARLHPDGSLDAGFNVGSGTNNLVNSIALLSDGKILIGGAFSSYNGITKGRIARLNEDGTLDEAFNQGAGASGWIGSVVVQNNGKILVGGAFMQYNGTMRTRIARLNADGSLDGTFDPGQGPNLWITSIAVQSDDKIIIGGQFSAVNDVTRPYIARLNPNGSLDDTFEPGTGFTSAVREIVLQTDGKALVCGAFMTFDGDPCKNFARLLVCEAPITSVAYSGNTFIADASDASYQWLDCSGGNTPIPGATSQSFEPPVNGLYAVSVSQNGCTSTSACYGMFTGVTDVAANGNFTVQPNPIQTTAELRSLHPLRNATLTVVNAQGQPVHMLQGLNGSMVEIQRNGMSAGVYVVRLTEGDAVLMTRKVVFVD
jgi:uncharacterized delta-60 repeat protein